uniref:hypothetical protein n=1 Tax=uncultured Muribaculum sp. TaxID=1918613 RepID=UPI0025A59978
ITDGTVCVFIDAVADNDSALVLYVPLKQRSQLIDDRLASLLCFIFFHVSVQTLMYLNPVKR